MKRAPDHLRNRICQNCGAHFSVKPCKAAKFCSRSCKDFAHRKHPRNDPRPCIRCGKEFTPSRHYGRARYCSKSCIWAATKGPNFNAAIARSTAVERAARQRGKGQGKSYRKLMGRHEHRVVAESIIGRRLGPGEIVHHVDGNILNNAPSNLAIMTQAEHMRLHGLGIPGVPRNRKLSGDAR